MDISTSPIQSYQKNQNLAGWVEQTEQNQAINETASEDKSPDETTVFIGEDKKVYQWLAQKFPKPFSEAATLGRLNQALFNYGLFSMSDIGVVNELALAQDTDSVQSALFERMTTTESYADQKQLRHITQVFETVIAATENIAA